MANTKGIGACAAEINAATGGRLTDDELEQVVELIQKKRARLDASGQIDNIDRRMAEIAAEEGDRAKLAAALQRKQTALTILARDRVDGHLGALTGAGLSARDAVLALFEGTTHGVSGARKSIYAQKQAFEGRYHASMIAALEQEIPAWNHLLRDKSFADDVLREMYEFRDGGTPGKTGNADAKAAAKIFARYTEIARTDLNAFGANIGKLAGWAPQSHDATKMLRVTRDTWVDSILPKLDLERSFPDLDGAEIREVLGDVYETIATGKDNTVTAARKGERTGPANLGKKLGRERVLHFKDADSWLAYADEFSRGNAITGVLDHQRRSAAIASQMQMLGPNPEVLMASVLDEQQSRIKADKSLTEKERSDQINQMTLEGSYIGQAMRESQGYTMSVQPGNLSKARFWGGARAVMTTSKLGGAVLSSIADVPTQAINLRYNGVSLFDAYAGQVTGMVKAIAHGRASGSANDRQIAFLLGEGFDGIIDNVVSSTFSNDGLPGWTSARMTGFFKASGLTFWTDMTRSVGVRMYGAQMGKIAKKAWGKLDDQTRHVMNQHGIGDAQWEIIRQTRWKGPNGTFYLIPDAIGDLPDDAFASLVSGKVTPSKLRRAKLDTELSLRRYYADEVNFGIIETDARSRRFTLRGTQAGTLNGELLRNLMQFKSWPVAFTQRVWGRAIHGQRDSLTRAQKMMHIGHIIAGLSLAGYASMTLKDYIKGYEPRRLQDQDGTVAWKTIMAAMSQGGAAGIYGDFLFGQTNRFGGGLLDTFAGPLVGEVAQLGDNLLKARDGEVKGGDWLNQTLQNTPYLNLFYAKPVLDYLILNSWKESLQPGFLARQATNRRKDYGQTLWHRQTIQ